MIMNKRVADPHRMARSVGRLREQTLLYSTRCARLHRLLHQYTCLYFKLVV